MHEYQTQGVILRQKLLLKTMTAFCNGKVSGHKENIIVTDMCPSDKRTSKHTNEN